jgi:hypothetical protein
MSEDSKLTVDDYTKSSQQKYDKQDYAGALADLAIGTRCKTL